MYFIPEEFGGEKVDLAEYEAWTAKYTPFPYKAPDDKKYYRVNAREYFSLLWVFF